MTFDSALTSLALLWLASSAPAPEPEPTPTPAAVVHPSEDPWSHFATLPRETQAQLFRETPILELFEHGRRNIEALGMYRTHCSKKERFGPHMPQAQEIDLLVREKPYAIVADFKKGPGAGRRLLYSATLRPKDLLVREAGPLGWAGAVWLNISGGLATNGTRYLITDFGLGPVLRLLTNNYREADQNHTLARDADEGWDRRGHWCVRHHGRAGAPKPYEMKSRLCFDPALVAPVDVQNSDAGGPFESFLFTDIKPITPGGKDPFTPKAAGL